MAVAHTELFQKGLGPKSDINYYWLDSAVIAEWDDQIIGLITFRHEDKKPRMDIMLGYVRPDYRRMGIYLKLWNTLLQRGRDKGASVIWGATHLQNTPMREFYNKVGRGETHVSSYFRIK